MGRVFLYCFLLPNRLLSHQIHNAFQRNTHGIILLSLVLRDVRHIGVGDGFPPLQLNIVFVIQRIFLLEQGISPPALKR